MRQRINRSGGLVEYISISEGIEHHIFRTKHPFGRCLVRIVNAVRGLPSPSSRLATPGRAQGAWTSYLILYLLFSKLSVSESVGQRASDDKSIQQQQQPIDGKSCKNIKKMFHHHRFSSFHFSHSILCSFFLLLLLLYMVKMYVFSSSPKCFSLLLFFVFHTFLFMIHFYLPFFSAKPKHSRRRACVSAKKRTSSNGECAGGCWRCWLNMYVRWNGGELKKDAERRHHHHQWAVAAGIKGTGRSIIRRAPCVCASFHSLWTSDIIPGRATKQKKNNNKT